MEKLALLDFDTKEVHIYNVFPDADISEDRIESLGHNTNMCQWMFGEDIKVVKHKGVLK